MAGAAAAAAAAATGSRIDESVGVCIDGQVMSMSMGMSLSTSISNERGQYIRIESACAFGKAHMFPQGSRKLGRANAMVMLISRVTSYYVSASKQHITMSGSKCEMEADVAGRSVPRRYQEHTTGWQSNSKDLVRSRVSGSWAF